jgi:hypothetical protein
VNLSGRQGAEGPRVRARERVVAAQLDAALVDPHHALDQLAAGLARVGGQHDVSGAWTGADDEQPVAGSQARRHGSAAHLDGVEPSARTNHQSDEDEEPDQPSRCHR